MSEREMPGNLEAERSVLGALMVNARVLDVVAPILEAQDFARAAHVVIYEAILELADRHVAADFLTVREALASRGRLSDVGGPAYVASLADGMPASTNAVYYARIVKEKSTLRRVILAANQVMNAAYDDGEPQDVIARAEAAFLDISQETVSSDPVFADALEGQTRSLLERISAEKRPTSGISTGFTQLDWYTRGLHRGNLIVLGGRPGDGKSSLALQMAMHVAKSDPVLLFSMEMSKEEIATRAIASLGPVDHHYMMLGRLGDHDQRKLGRALTDFGQHNLGIDDTASMTPLQIRSKAKRVKSQRGLSLIVVDYLQLLTRPKNAHSREEAVADNSRALKVIAGELDVPVLLLSQLNRTVESRGDRKPTLSDLRESGAIEQDANAVFLIYRPPPTSNGAVTETPPVELLIAKQRNGPQQVSVQMVFHGPNMRFDEIAS